MWFLPTMGRAQQCQEVINCMMRAEMTTPGVVLVNEKFSADYARLRVPDNWSVRFLGENIGVCGALNDAFRIHENEPWYGLVCDDEFMSTRGFDEVLIEAAGEWCIAHANDGWKSQTRIHSFPVYGGNLLRAIGWWAVPGLWHWFFDDLSELIAAEFRLRRFCEGIHAEHRHHAAGRSNDDATYQIGRSRADEDKAVFASWEQNEWPQLKEKLRSIIPSSVTG